MYLKQITAATNKGMGRSHVEEISHDGVTLRLKSKRVNCVRYQTLEIVFKDRQGQNIRIGPCPLSSLGDKAYVTQHTPLKNIILRWLKQLDGALPAHVELAIRALINRNCYITPICQMLKKSYTETQYACESVKGVSLTPQRAVMVLPTINGHHVRLDFRLKRKKYVTYFSITHPDRVMENERGEKRSIAYTEQRYGYILGARGLYTLLSGWYERSTAPNVDMLKATGPELLEMINGDKRRTIDEFFTIINGQVSTHVSIP